MENVSTRVVAFQQTEPRSHWDQFPRKKNSHGHIADFPQLDGRPQLFTNVSRNLLLGPARQRVGVVQNIPILALPDATIRPHSQPCSAGHLTNTTKERLRCRSRSGKTGSDRTLFVDNALLLRIAQQCLDLRCKRNSTVMDAVIKRLNADTIANQP